MRDYIFEKLGGVKLKLSDGINAIVDNSDAKHIANRGKNNMQKSEISNIENIIKNAKYYNKVSATHPKFTNFRYYEIPVKFGETIAFVTVNVGYGKTDSQYHIYDLTEPKERNTPNRINGFAGPVGNLLRKGVSNSIISTSEQKSQEKNSDDEKLSSGMLEQLRYNPEAYTKRLLKNCKIPANEENVKYYSDKLKAITRLHNKGRGSRAEYEFSLDLF